MTDIPQAAIEVAAKAIRLRDSTDEFACARAALAAAAPFMWGESLSATERVARELGFVDGLRVALAEVFDWFTRPPKDRTKKNLIAAIRALNPEDKP